ncbi:MAG: putative ATPase involved in replication initiation [Hyphomicrobiales bacterium]|nr:putative ATPase involved in replication initiation [Hyphomicrobiales bacterium]
MRAAAGPVIERAALRLLGALCAPAAYGRLDPESGEVAIVGRRNGVSMCVARATRAEAGALAARDLAVWEEVAPGRSRLVATDPGRAALARASAPPEAPAFLAQHAGLETRRVEARPGASLAKVLVNADESPLGWLARRKLVGAAEFEAGERLRRDLDMAQTLPRVTANWSASPSAAAHGAQGLHISERVAAAGQRVDRALRAAGPEFAGLLLDVCGFLKGLETIEAERNWPRRSAKVVLALALGKLARHYGLGEPPAPRAAKAPQHWGAADYRPRIDPGEGA